MSKHVSKPIRYTICRRDTVLHEINISSISKAVKFEAMIDALLEAIYSLNAVRRSETGKDGKQ